MIWCKAWVEVRSRRRLSFSWHGHVVPLTSMTWWDSLMMINACCHSKKTWCECKKHDATTTIMLFYIVYYVQQQQQHRRDCETTTDSVTNARRVVSFHERKMQTENDASHVNLEPSLQFIPYDYSILF
jgi:hypothetical protein